MTKSKSIQRKKTQPHSLDAAVLAIQDAWQTATHALVRIGQVVLDTCFDGDARVFLESGPERNAAYEELVKKVGALGVGLGEKTLQVALRIAAYDHVVRGNHWKVLDTGRKEDLLPLKEPMLLAEGAKFAVEMAPTRENLRKWVANKRAQEGTPAKPRGLSMQGTHALMGRLEGLDNLQSRKRMLREFHAASPAEQRRFREGVAQARVRLVRLEKQLGK